MIERIQRLLVAALLLLMMVVATKPATTVEEEAANHVEKATNNVVVSDRNDIVTLESFEDLQEIFESNVRTEEEHSRTSPLWLVLIYDSEAISDVTTCAMNGKHSSNKNDHLLQEFQQGHHYLQHFFLEKQQHQPPRFAQMDISGNYDMLRQQGVDVSKVPCLFFVTPAVKDYSHQEDNEEEEEDQEAAYTEESETQSAYKATSSSPSHSFLLEYVGRSRTAYDIFQTVLHYYNKIVLTGVKAEWTEDFLYMKLSKFETLQDLLLFLQDHHELLLSNHSMISPGLPNAMSMEEKEYIRWLLSSSASVDDTNGFEDVLEDYDFTVFAECQSKPRTTESHLEQIARIMSGRRNVLFFLVETCHGQEQHDNNNNHATSGRREDPDGTIYAWRIPVLVNSGTNKRSLAEVWKDTAHQTVFYPIDENIQPEKKNEVREQARDLNDDDNEDDDEDEVDSENEYYWNMQQAVMEFLVKGSTPSVLWFDRQLTAPIAFPNYRHVHAVLFVPFHHPLERDTAVHRIVSDFRRACRNHRNERGWKNYVDEDMVCLIVPSTETRIMMTMGIDVWGAIDAALVNSKDEASSTTMTAPQAMLPTLLITDQRSGGITKRFYLGANELMRDSSTSATGNAVQGFVEDFWSNRLQPVWKTCSNSKSFMTTNKFGVHILHDGNYLKDFLQRRYQQSEQLHEQAADNEIQPKQQQHAMVFFTSPTCGHCKRFSTMYNQLGRFLSHIQWDSNASAATTTTLTLFKVDVTCNEDAMQVLLRNESVTHVPDLYYVAPSGSLIRYTRGAMGAGQMNHFMDIVTWWLDEGEFANDELQGLLNDLEERFE